MSSLYVGGPNHKPQVLLWVLTTQQRPSNLDGQPRTVWHWFIKKKKKVDLGVTGKTKLVGMFSKKVMKWQATNSI